MRKLSLFLLLVLGIILLIGCSKAKKGLLPGSIAKFELESTVKGEQAKKSVTFMHSGANIKLKEAAIGDYYSGNFKAKLWIGKTQNNEQAKILIKRMTRKISTGKSPFGKPDKVVIKGTKVVKMEAMNQTHYYYRIKDKVVWLSVDSFLAKETILDLIKKVK